MSADKKAIKIFIAYSQKDRTALDDLRTHAAPLLRQGNIEIWYDGEIIAGEVWDTTIKANLHAADIILLLLSAHSLASEYFYKEEVTDALKRHEEGVARVVPIILSACQWQRTPLAKLQGLPTGMTPISNWTNRDDAWNDVWTGLSDLIDELERMGFEQKMPEIVQVKPTVPSTSKPSTAEEHAWDFAIEDDDRAAYEKFLIRFSDGFYAAAARERLAAFDADDLLWELVMERGTEKAVQKYLEKYPNGLHIDKARQKLTEFGKESGLNKKVEEVIDLLSYECPGINLLEDYAEQKFEVDRAELEANKDQIIETLLNYKIEIVKIRATVGPTVTLFEIVPAPGVRISLFKEWEYEIALSLSALGIRIIAPIPGKGTIGIEVPNKNKQVVSMKDVLVSEKFKRAKMDLPIALGKTISNEVYVVDLAQMPHLLIAGASGQGKSIGINSFLISLLYKKHPSQVKIVLIDPKKVELLPYSKLENHFLAFLPGQEEPITTDTTKVIHTLNSLCIEMDTRYDLLKKAGARNIREYNEKFVLGQLIPIKGHKFIPFIVVVIDEFADLIMTAGKEAELPIGRLAQLSRAVGIHLIIATQHPSINVITDIIEANFPARIAYKVTAKVDSLNILDGGGAEQLIGRGDMLLSVGGEMVRLQGAFVDKSEVERVVDFISKQPGYPEPYKLPEFIGDDERSTWVIS